MSEPRDSFEGMAQLALSLKRLSWAEMVRVGQHISDNIETAILDDSPINRDSVSQWLSEMANDILREYEAERAATQTAPDPE